MTGSVTSVSPSGSTLTEDATPDSRAAAISPLSQTNGTQLGQRPNRFGEPSFNCFQPGDERGRHRAHTGDQNPQFALGGRDLDVVLIGQLAVSFLVEML